VFADLPPPNSIGDGVGYYFAEAVPEPASLGVLAVGALVLLRRTRARGGNTESSKSAATHAPLRDQPIAKGGDNL
jgi:hypothetical protein